MADWITALPRNIASRYRNGQDVAAGTTVTMFPQTSVLYTEGSNEVRLIQETGTVEARILTSCLRTDTNFAYFLQVQVVFAGENNATPQIFEIDLFNLQEWPGFSGWADVNEAVVATENYAVAPTLTASAAVTMTSDSTVRFSSGNTASNRKATWKLFFVQ